MDVANEARQMLRELLEMTGETVQLGIIDHHSVLYIYEMESRRAIRMALALQEAYRPISDAWAKLGHEVGLGIGIAQGDTTLGVIGFEQRWEYAAIGNVPNLAARLCGAAHSGEIILDAQTEQDIVGIAETEFVGALTLRGFQQPVPAFRLKSMRS